jgi:hypothetical protein
MAGSTDLITYLNYIATWETESDGNIDKLLGEHRLFVGLGDFNSDTAINDEFSTLVSLAKEVRDWTVAADVVEMAADAAAVASFWSFGLGMAAFAVLEGEAAIDKAVASSKSQKLNDKLKTADTDIASNISSNVGNYVTEYKSNNTLIVSKAPKGMDTKECRSYLLQFIGEIEKKEAKIDAATFKKYAASARMIYDSDEIGKVYDALDELNLSGKSTADIEKFMKVIANLGVAPAWSRQIISFVQGVSLVVALKNLNVQRSTITECAEAAGLPVEEVEASAFKMMDCYAKFAVGIAVIFTVIDVVMDIMDLVNVVEQCDKMVDELDGTIKTSYQGYFDSIKTDRKSVV